MKPLDPNDPRFTAKALGEEESRDIHPETKQEFDSLLEFADTLKSELRAQDTQDTLTEEQKERVRKAVEPQEKKLLKFPMWINAVAACLVLGLVGIVSFKILETSNQPETLGETRVLPSPPHTKPTGSDTTEISNHVRRDEANFSSLPELMFKDLVSEQPSPDDRIRSANERSSVEDEIHDLEQFVIEEDDNAGFSGGYTTTGPRMSQQLLKVDELQLPKVSDYSLDGDSKPSVTRFFSQQPLEQETGEVYELSPFEVDFAEQGYTATTTLSGTRIRSSLRDTPASTGTAKAEPKAKPDTLTVYEPPLPEPTRKLAYADAPSTLLNQRRQETWNREAYDRIVENAFKSPRDHALSTFSIDVDTASYANMRRYLNSGSLPPTDAIRIEELVNYFSYDYEGPQDDTPFAVHVDAASAPWNKEHRLIRIGLQGEKVDLSERPQANLVFLIDVSGSMSDQNKLPLVQRAMNLLVDQMGANDRIAVVVYAGASGLALPSTTANNKETIQHAITNLQSGGSTNGGAGIELAYSVAQKHFIEGGINRVILCTDGDFNVGTTDRGSLTRLIEEKAKTGVFFSALGFGHGNYQDATMEELSNKGNGNYGYVDSFKEARKVFVDDMLGTLFTIAKDVKIQVEFNPAKVAQYRLIGYENRILAKEDFNDDTKDAGEIGAGHTVTALYEIIPTRVQGHATSSVDPLKYQTTAIPKTADESTEMLTVKLRYKEPDEDISQLLEHPFIDSRQSFDNASDDFRFASSVAAFGMLLRGSEFAGEISLEDIRTQIESSQGNDTRGLRSEFLHLVEQTMQLMPQEGR